MLKCLELIGFKSFADKTRFEFGSGITAIVGPNGSGKSNVVDAIRWILGEQSAKSLRGKEMADVIFNGSGTRRSLGMAEVSLTLDNQGGYLPIETDEVVLSRRVYRGGEGEYLINGRIARLRDIRELFLGTGAGAGAYSIIEQGKVDLMLQASTKDRRHIFEEAAGTSRFKAKKIEALRRLDRVDHNLLRVQDIHDEVEKQLRSLRAQAGKARKYKEYSDRLRGLRLAIGRLDVAGLDRRIEQATRAIEALAGRRATLEVGQAECDGRLRLIDDSLAEREEAARRLARELGEVRARGTALQAEVAAADARAVDLAAAIERDQRALAESRSGLARRDAEAAELAARIGELERERELQAATVVEAEASLAAAAALLARQRAEHEETRRRHAEQFRDLSRLENEQSALDGQLAHLWNERGRLERERDEVTRETMALTRSAATFRAQRLKVALALGRCEASGGELRQDHALLLQERSERLSQLARLRDEYTAAASRAEVLENLRLRHEGLQGGVKQALARRERGEEAWRPVVGVLAECLSASGEDADLIELGLGARAQALVVEGDAPPSEKLLAAARELPGRVTFLPLEENGAGGLVVFSEEIPGPSLATLVECAERFRPLVERLLGNTFLVEDFETARRIAVAELGVRLVTRSGEVVEPDGSIAAGPRRATAGILSRAAELRTLDEKRDGARKAIDALEGQLADCAAALARLESRLGLHELARSTLAEQDRHFDQVLRRDHQRAVELERRRGRLAAEIGRIDQEIAQVDREGTQIAANLDTLHAEIARLSAREVELSQSLLEREAERGRLESALTAAQVALARVAERREAARGQSEQIDAARATEARRTRDLIESLRQEHKRQVELELERLAARAQLADIHARLDQLAGAEGASPELIDNLRAERKALSAQSTESRRQLDLLREELHARELEVTQLRLERGNLVGRIREDYGVDLTADAPAAGSGDTAADVDLTDPRGVRAEIDALKEKIARLGGVNTAAIVELEDLELRASTLAYQIGDLVTAKRHLEEVILKINEESRRLFLDTFETVREHFQDLFRKLFGGGRADILLEDETDVLESGIEIIARPPGKEPRSISLLSGGEKTMTAVALLMALFRSKPTPFCILDEVDAALDEANISRFVAALREFLDRSQFILITHSKTTMAAADVLHGVTQRESGVSIRVSVRLDDVTEDGQILERSESAHAG